MTEEPAQASEPAAGVPLEQVVADEARRIAHQRRARGFQPEQPEKSIGLALSGGGIRSASFALGVIQALERHQHLIKFDYLSTVSGGGYIGGALTWAYTRDRFSRVPRSFPFGFKAQVLKSTAPAAVSPSSEPRLLQDNVAFIRQHGQYLAPTRRLNIFGLVATILRNAVVTSSVYFALLLVPVLYLVKFRVPVLERLSKDAFMGRVDDTLVPATLFALLFFVLSLIFALMTWGLFRFQPSSGKQYGLRLFAHRVFGWCLLGGLGMLALGVLPHLYYWLERVTVSVSTAGIIGVIGVIFEFMRQQRPQLAAAWPRLAGFIVWIAGLALIYALLMLAFGLATAVSTRLSPENTLRVLGLLVAYAVLIGAFLNGNMFGIHRMYRDRLTEAFLPDSEAVRRRRWKPAFGADVGFLTKVNSDEDPGPYHLVNACVVLTGSDYASYRGRGGDNFVMSSLYCGSEAVGWHPTTRFCGGKMTLATAMAISGAAVNPNTGASGRGPTRNRLASFMLALFNIRLGYWVRNPHARQFTGWITSFLWPNLLYPGLRQGLLGSGQHTRAGFLELTDGGHFDNTGLYELIRRQLDVIVLSLASADPKYGFDDLADAIERVRVDFGAYIEFKGLFAAALPGGLTAPPGIAAALKLSQSGHEEGTILYPSGKNGTLIVLKSALRVDMPVDALRYAGEHVEFPNESTADQFFDERQFEAYREAGYAVCRGMIENNKSKLWF